MSIDARSVVTHARRKQAALLALSSRLGQALGRIVESVLTFHALPEDRGRKNSPLPVVARRRGQWRPEADHLLTCRMNAVRERSEPPPPGSRRTAPFLIGRNSRGNWVVRDPSGLRGGLFIDRVQAMKYAMFESGHRSQAAIMVPGILELDMTTRPPR